MRKGFLKIAFWTGLQDFSGLTGFQLVHHEEATGNLSFGLRSFTVSHGCMPNAFVEECAERSEALKSDFETDVSHAQFVAAEQLFRFLDAAFDQVLVWGYIECLAEETKKMVTRKAGLLGNLFEIERMVVAVIDKVTRAIKPLERFDI